MKINDLENIQAESLPILGTYQHDTYFGDQFVRRDQGHDQHEEVVAQTE